MCKCKKISRYTSCSAACVDSVVFHCFFSSRKPFSEFSLDGEMVERLKKLGFATTFEIQEKTLPITLEGRLVACIDYIYHTAGILAGIKFGGWVQNCHCSWRI